VLPLIRRYADRARDLLDPQIVDYIEQGSGEEVSLSEAVLAWQRLRLRPHALVDVSHVDTGITLLGITLAAPVIAGPTAAHGLVHPDAEIATAQGVHAAGSLMTVSTRASAPIEQIAAELPDGWWFQVYLTREPKAAHGAALRAARAGARALVLTGDTPYLGRKSRVGRLTALNTHTGMINLGRHLPPSSDPAWALEQDPAATEHAITDLTELTGLPVLVKGVLRGDDAERFLAAGAAGVIVSNHGGRQLDQAISTADALPEVAAAVAGRVPVLVDGGIRSGVHVLAALAFGASAVLLGRPLVWALAADGADGVRDTLLALHDDLGHCMALAGVTCCAAANPSLLGFAAAPVRKYARELLTDHERRQ
jgi:4-hydroxymandelate oxidase